MNYKMKKQHVQTSFLKFLLEKQSNEKEEKIKRKHLIDDLEVEDDDDEIDDLEPKDEIEEEDDELSPKEKKDDLIINELLNEYKRLKKKYENTKLYNRRK